VRLSDGEIAELNEASSRGLERSGELRARLLEGSAAPRTGEYVAETLALHDDAGSPEEQAALVRAAKAGDQRAREQLIERYLPLVVSLARSFRVEGLEFADLVQEGVVGLLRALERFDPDRGVPFPAYATWWVRYSLQELRSDFMRPIRLPRQALRELSQLKSRYEREYAAEGRQPNLYELAERIGIDRDRAEELLRANALMRSLSELAAVDEGSLGGSELGTLGDLLEDPVSAEVHEDVLDRVEGARLRALLSRLTAQEREILTARFGLDGRAPERLVDIAERLGVSVDRVRRLQRRALAKLARTPTEPPAGTAGSYAWSGQPHPAQPSPQR
jgi:RNA polymerase sigma factor (sigma-70 family)